MSNKISSEIFIPLLDLNETKFKILHSNRYYHKDDPNLIGPHIHDGYEIYLNISGDVSFLINNKLYPVKKGEIAISLPNDVHHCIYNKSCIVEHFVLWIKADKNSCLLNFINKKDFSPLIVLKEDIKENLMESFFKLYKCLNSERPNELLTTAYLLEILGILNTGENLLDAKNVDNKAPKSFNILLQEIGQNISTITTVKDLSDLCYLSPATINRYFRKYLHLSPKEYLELKKLSLAKELMGKGASVTEAGFEAGFYDASHFISVYKKRFNKTPFQDKKNKI